MKMTRNYSIDLLRVFCCVLVIGIHVVPTYSPPYNINANNVQIIIMQSIVRVGLPVFFILSGMFLLNNKYSSLFSFYKKRLSSLVIPFLIYSFLHYLIVYRPDMKLSSISNYLSLIYAGQTSLSIHFWFVYVMLGIYVITPAIKFITDKIPHDKVNISIIFLISLSVYNTYIRELSQAVPIVHNIVPVQSIDSWLSYFIIGGLITKKQKDHAIINKRNIIIISSVMVFHIFCVFLLKYKSYFNTFPYDKGISMFLLSILMVVIFSRIKISQENKIASISKYTYGVYLIHVAVIDTITRMNVNFSIIENITLQSLIKISIVFFASIIIVFIVDNLITNRINKLITR